MSDEKKNDNDQTAASAVSMTLELERAMREKEESRESRDPEEDATQENENLPEDGEEKEQGEEEADEIEEEDAVEEKETGEDGEEVSEEEEEAGDGKKKKKKRKKSRKKDNKKKPEQEKTESRDTEEPYDGTRTPGSNEYISIEQPEETEEEAEEETADPNAGIEGPEDNDNWYDEKIKKRFSHDREYHPQETETASAAEARRLREGETPAQADDEAVARRFQAQKDAVNMSPAASPSSSLTIVETMHSTLQELKDSGFKVETPDGEDAYSLYYSEQERAGQGTVSLEYVNTGQQPADEQEKAGKNGMAGIESGTDEKKTDVYGENIFRRNERENVQPEEKKGKSARAYDRTTDNLHAGLDFDADKAAQAQGRRFMQEKPRRHGKRKQGTLEYVSAGGKTQEAGTAPAGNKKAFAGITDGNKGNATQAGAAGKPGQAGISDGTKSGKTAAGITDARKSSTTHPGTTERPGKAGVRDSAGNGHDRTGITEKTNEKSGYGMTGNRGGRHHGKRPLPEQETSKKKLRLRRSTPAGNAGTANVISPDGKRAVAKGEHAGRVRILRLQKGKDGSSPRHTGNVTARGGYIGTEELKGHAGALRHAGGTLKGAGTTASIITTTIREASKSREQKKDSDKETDKAGMRAGNMLGGNMLTSQAGAYTVESGKIHLETGRTPGIVTGSSLDSRKGVIAGRRTAEKKLQEMQKRRVNRLLDKLKTNKEIEAERNHVRSRREAQIEKAQKRAVKISRSGKVENLQAEEYTDPMTAKINTKETSFLQKNQKGRNARSSKLTVGRSDRISKGGGTLSQAARTAKKGDAIGAVFRAKNGLTVTGQPAASGGGLIGLMPDPVAAKAKAFIAVAAKKVLTGTLISSLVIGGAVGGGALLKNRIGSTSEDFFYPIMAHTNINGSDEVTMTQNAVSQIGNRLNAYRVMAGGNPMPGNIPVAGAPSGSGQTIKIPDGLGDIFSYMSWQMITSPSSPQYALREQAGMNFNSEGFGIINGRYVIAMTTKFGQVGEYVDVYLKNGTILNCILGDSKGDPGGEGGTVTEWGHNHGHCVVEFVVDENTWYYPTYHENPGTSGCHPEWDSDVDHVVLLGSYFDNPSLSGGAQTGQTAATASVTDPNSTKNLKNIGIAKMYWNGGEIETGGMDLSDLKGYSTSYTYTGTMLYGNDNEGKPLGTPYTSYHTETLTLSNPNVTFEFVDREGNKLSANTQTTFIKQLLSMSALGAYYADPTDEDAYYKYMYDLVDIAITKFGGAEVRFSTSPGGGTVTWSDGAGGTATAGRVSLSCTVKVPVCSDLAALEESDPNFNSWEYWYDDGDMMPAAYMSLKNEDFDEIFNVSLSAMGSGVMFTGMERTVYEFFSAKGYDAIRIAAIMANIKAESGFDASVVNSIGASGLCQWLGERLEHLKEYAKSKGTTWKDVQTQLEFADLELQKPGSNEYVQWLTDGHYQAFIHATTAGDAAIVMATKWERYGNEPSENTKRAGYASAYYQKIMAGAGGGNSQLLQIAISQLGNVGGEPYWSWAGFGGHVPWCACFVSWCENQAGLISTDQAPMFTWCGQGAQWFADRGQFRYREEYTPAPGDIIFFSWSGDQRLGGLDHVGIVESVDETYIHTVEGNSSDMCKRNQYARHDTDVIGYGIIPGGNGAGTGSMIWPTTSRYISSPYGYRISPTYGASTFHEGIDIAGSTGDPIYAVLPGTVKETGYNSGEGNYVHIDHGGGIVTEYMHNSEVYVKAGDIVTQGQTIAAQGSTGISTGSHLHFSVMVNGSYADPLQYVSKD